LGLDVIKDGSQRVGFFSEISNDAARAFNDFSWFSILVELAKSNPFSQNFGGDGDLEQLNLVFSAQGFNQSSENYFEKILKFTWCKQVQSSWQTKRKGELVVYQGP
jgi:hypothetical protein